MPIENGPHQSDERATERTALTIGAAVALAVVQLCVLFPLVTLLLQFPFPYWFGDASTRGQFGDQYGALNALFSGLAFAGVIFAIMLQRQELRYQREELAATREEMKLAREETRLARIAHEKSEEALRKRIEQEEQHAVTQATLAMLDEWHSPLIQRARVAAQRFVFALDYSDDSIMIEDLMTAQVTEIPITIAIDDLQHAVTMEDIEAIFRILNYLAKWAGLRASERIDHQLLLRLIGSSTAWWRTKFLATLHAENAEDNAYLDSIRAGVANKTDE